MRRLPRTHTPVPVHVNSRGTDRLVTTLSLVQWIGDWSTWEHTEPFENLECWKEDNTSDWRPLRPFSVSGSLSMMIWGGILIQDRLVILMTRTALHFN